MSRAVVIDAATGVIKRKVAGDPTMMALQVGPGESLYALAEDDGALIDDRHLIVSETGEWEAAPGAPEGFLPPTIPIFYVPA